jgi:filamentous hemagglutinin family protein
MKLKPLIAAILLFFQHPVLADIVTDGTVGDASNIGRVQPINPTSAGQLTIGQELGSLKGGNLFHSFQQFDIEKNETATFTGDDTIQNVISRVTGGNKSHINGILRSEVGSADFYFINPAGVVFEENSQVDVPASFHISTAGELIFDDGSSFSALNPEASTLTVATPEAFGFTSGQNGSLEIIGGQLVFKPGANVSLSANSLNIKQKASLTVEHGPPSERLSPIEEPGIRLDLAAIDSSTTQEIPITGVAKTEATGGELLINDSEIIISGDGSGRLAIRAGTMTAHDSLLSVDNVGNQDMKSNDGVDAVVDSLELVGTSLTSRAQIFGKGSNVSVIAKKVIQLSDGGNISVEGFFPKINPPGSFGHTGNAIVKAGQLIIDGQDSGILAKVNEMVSGNIEVTVDESTKVLNGGRIGSIKKGRFGSATGILTVNSEQLIIDGKESRIGSEAIEGRFGFVGKVTVSVKELIQVLNGGNIGTDSVSANGRTGDVEVRAGQLIINGQDTGISIDSNNLNGQSGNVKVFVDESIQVLNGGEISSSTDVVLKGSGGNINIKSGEWIQLQNATIKTSDEGTESLSAGDIIIEVPVLVLDAGKIIASTLATTTETTGGNVVLGEVLAPTLTLEGIVNDPNIIKPVQLVASEDNFETDPNIIPSPINIISAASTGELKITSPELNIIGALADVIPPSLNIERLSQDPCAYGDENSFKKLGYGGAPAFQHGENYLLINRFDESGHEPDDRGMLETTPSINADLGNTATECAKSQRTSLN